ncbi:MULTISPECIES: DUF2946 domain-containing protein [unclassified Pseudomonas]|uniref:DUF2946 domain-containing protein n=1 Tax=unclassified Pseudomonas TaxID=196821 RepID=UPI00224B01C7|nr:MULTISPECIES: DUF2946 domain-containing protein [unclassified Pseudomonas]MCX2887884.1 DUF2946 domain-containing protein [Pseudomonas sp. DCB_BI]MDH4553249.1 DUF2946 domain-containing protein [Pseudomonas sp. BN607]
MSLPRNSTRRTTRPDRRRAGGGWLSLFAMWMIFIGPLISQSMPMDHHAGMRMPMDMPMTAAHQHGDAHHGHGSDGQLHVMWEKCGYCSLLFNCPALPQALSPLSAGGLAPTSQLFAATHQGHARQAVFPGARSRAPPSSISV